MMTFVTAVFAPEKPRLNQTRNELSYINNISFLMDDPVSWKWMENIIPRNNL